MNDSQRPRIHVLAGVNGAGKCSIGGAAIRQQGGEYYNPDEAARTIKAQARSLTQAAQQGIELHIWYVGLSSLALHIERVQARVSRGGHDIPRDDIRRRYEQSRLNLITLLPHLTTLRVYDNSTEADPAAGRPPQVKRVLHMERRRILGPPDLAATPQWAKPIVAAALKIRQS